MKLLISKVRAICRVAAVPAIATVVFWGGLSMVPAAAQDNKYATAKELGLMEGFPPPMCRCR